MNKIIIIATVIIIALIGYTLSQPRQTTPVVKVPDIIAQPTAIPTVAPLDYSGLQTVDETVGEGAEAVAGKQVSVQYRGKLEDGTEFDSSYSRPGPDGQPTPLTFVLGSGQLIPGFDRGVTGMKVGGSRTITIPPGLAYGANPPGDKIPPNATLVFEVALEKVE